MVGCTEPGSRPVGWIGRAFGLLLLLCLGLPGCATLGAKMAYNEVMEQATKGCDPGEALPGQVRYEDCLLVGKLIQQWGISRGLVGFDRAGKLELRGEYETEDEVDRAFIAAQTVAGPALVSPVTPRNIKILQWRSASSAAEDGRGAVGRPQQGNKYALLIGVSRFAPGSKIPPIKTAVQDVKDMSRMLASDGHFDRIITITDEQATRKYILETMDSLKTKLEPGDLIVLYVSSHGSAPDKFGRLNIIPYDLNAGPALKLLGGWDPAQRHTEAQYLAVAKARYEVQRSAIPADEITDFMKDSPAGRVVGILDVCYSGAALDGLFSPLGDAGYQVRERSNVQGISARQVTAALGLSGEKDLIAEGQSLPTQSSVRHAGIRDFSYPELGVPSAASGTDSSTQTGKVLLTATSGGEQSLFDSSGETGIRNSFFTYFLLQGLEATGGQTRKAFEYSRPRTWSIARDLAHKQQTPQYQTNPNNNRLNLPLF